MSVNLQWFESLCATLAKNPKEATRALEEFRESDMAIEACVMFLSSPQASDQAKFHGSMIVQYAIINRWSFIDGSVRLGTKSALGTCISELCRRADSPRYVMNKCFQVFASIWKRGWLECPREENMQLFHFVSSLLLSPQSARAGARLLLVIVEEFCNKTFAELQLPFEFHLKVKRSFEAQYLSHVFSLAMENALFPCLKLFVDTMTADAHQRHLADPAAGNSRSSLDAVVPMLSDTLALAVAVISWDFSDIDSQRSSSGVGAGAQSASGLSAQSDTADVHSHILDKVPREWAGALLHSNLLSSVFECYHALQLERINRALNLASISASMPSSSSKSGNRGFAVGDDWAGRERERARCLVECRNLVVCFASLNGQLFGNDLEKAQWCDMVLQGAMGTLSSALHRAAAVASDSSPSPSPRLSTAAHAETERHCREERDFQSAEEELFATTVLRLISNFKLATVVQHPHTFERMVVCLGELTSVLSAEMRDVAQSALAVADQAAAAGAAGDARQREALLSSVAFVKGENLLQSRQSELLSLALDVWSAVLENSALLDLLIANSSSSSLSSASLCVVPKAANVSASENFKVWLSNVAGHVFAQLFECIVCVYQTVDTSSGGGEEDSEEEDVAEEEELIEARCVEDLLGGCCTVGRVAFSSSLRIVGHCLQSVLSECGALAAHAHTGAIGGCAGVGVGESMGATSRAQHQQLHQQHHQISKSLEKARVCVLFASYLCVEDFHQVAQDMSRDAPAICPLILHAIRAGVGTSSGTGTGGGTGITNTARDAERGVDEGAAVLPANDTVPLLYEIVRLAAEYLHFQISILSPQPTPSASAAADLSPLLSPLLMDSLMRFFTEYVLRFVDPDPALYGQEVWLATPQLALINGEDFNGVLGLLLESVAAMVERLPFQAELLVDASRLLSAVARSAARNSSRLSFLLLSQHAPSSAPSPSSLLRIAQMITAPDASWKKQQQQQQQLQDIVPSCRANADVLGALVCSVADLFCVSSAGAPLFQELCTKLYERTCSVGEVFQQVAQRKRAAFPPDTNHQIERALAALSGIARCSVPSGAPQGVVLVGLFDACLPLLREVLRASVDADVLLTAYLLLLRDYAESHLSRLGMQSCLALYRCCFDLIGVYARRFREFDQRMLHEQNLQQQQQQQQEQQQQGGKGGYVGMREGALLFREQSCFYLLELLNCLAAKDFFFSADEGGRDGDTDGGGAEGGDIENEVAAVLIAGLELIMPLLTPEILNSFRKTADKYFSFIAFLCQVHPHRLVQWVHCSDQIGTGTGTGTTTAAAGSGKGRAALTMLLQQLLCGVCAVEGATAREALKALQAIALYQWKAAQSPASTGTPVGGGSAGFSWTLHSEVLVPVLDQLLEIVIIGRDMSRRLDTEAGGGVGAGGSAIRMLRIGLQWDRVDAVGNALFAFLLLDNQRFFLIVQSIAARQPAPVTHSANGSASGSATGAAGGAAGAMLLQCAQRLVSERGVSISAGDKQNRNRFTQNFRDFALQIKTLTLV